jgi:hypothetical protein
MSVVDKGCQDEPFGFCWDNEQITLEVERADGLATGTECVWRA